MCSMFIFACAIICLSLPCISVVTKVLIIPEIVCYHFIHENKHH